jgi:hypothetical protein
VNVRISDVQKSTVRCANVKCPGVDGGLSRQKTLLFYLGKAQPPVTFDHIQKSLDPRVNTSVSGVRVEFEG